LTACSNCGRELPEGALFCPDCGTSAAGFSVAQSDMSPSHFNSGMTATSPPLTAEPPAPAGEPGSAPLPSPRPEERKRSSFAGRRGLMLVIIGVLAVLLVGSTFESGILNSGEAPAVNSASTPLTGEELYAAYASNETQAAASYTNKTVYIQDSLASGVGMDYSTGQYYSYVDSGNVILYWSSQSQLGQLSAGYTVLAKCSVNGEQFSPGLGYLLILEDCALVSVQSQTTSNASISVNYD
jgi:zinc ribbon protein